METKLLQDYCLALLQASRTWRRLADATAKAFDLSEATAYPIVFIGRLGDGIRQSALAEAIGIEGPSLVRLLDQLCGLGLVTRREDPTDKRAKTLHLTPEGAALAATLNRDLDRLRHETFAGVSAEELRVGLKVFRALDEAAQRLEQGGGARAVA